MFEQVTPVFEHQAPVSQPSHPPEKGHSLIVPSENVCSSLVGVACADLLATQVHCQCVIPKIVIHLVLENSQLWDVPTSHSHNFTANQRKACCVMWVLAPRRAGGDGQNYSVICLNDCRHTVAPI